mmetsp:Transcript_33763/g.73906  ORF Transcript_33763/g.73906 Transcript_33763/m.73906 type:complete len:288 (-) Transcript_33763:102-965(-)
MKDSSSFSCSRDRLIMRSTMTPTMRFTRAKFVRTIMAMKYTAHNLWWRMAVVAMSGQPSNVTTQKWENRALPMSPKYSSTSGSPAFGWPISSTVMIEPVYMIMERRSDIQATARIEFPIVCTRMTSSLNMRRTRMRRTRRTRRNTRSTVKELIGLFDSRSTKGVTTQVSQQPTRVTEKSKMPHLSKNLRIFGISALIRRKISTMKMTRNRLSILQRPQFMLPSLTSISMPMKAALSRIVMPKKVSARMVLIHGFFCATSLDPDRLFLTSSSRHASLRTVFVTADLLL